MAQRAHVLLRHSLLGSECLYRVSGIDGALIELEVVRAPGLVPGTRVRVTGAAVRRMTAVPLRVASEVVLTDRGGRARRLSRRLRRRAAARP